MVVLLGMRHPAHGVLTALREREARQLKLGQKAVLQAYQPRLSMEASKLVDDLAGIKPSAGEANLARFNEGLEYLETHGLSLGYMQKQLMDVARLILIPRMFGDGISASLHKLKLKYAFKRLYEQAAITLPRRAGKTVAQTMLAALVAATQPDGNVCCFNLGARQSHEWLAQAIGVLRLFRGSKFDWQLKNIASHEKITIINCCGSETSISSYPGPKDADASNFRGMGTRLMLLLYDEFYFFKEVVYTTSLPLARNGAAILMISSMSKNHDDAVRHMIDAKIDEAEGDGEENKLFLKLDWLRACPDCVVKGAANACNHIEHRPQHFEPRGAMKRMKALISPFGKEDFMRELMNTLAKSNRLSVFLPGWIAPLRDPACDYRPVGARDYNEFFIGIDPAGGGFSNLAIVSVLFDKTHPPPGTTYTAVILAAEIVTGVDVTTHDLGEWVVRHADAVRRTIPGMRTAKAIVCIESKSIMVASSVTQAIMKLAIGGNMGVMMENAGARSSLAATDIDLRAGVTTTNASKEQIITKTRTLLTNGAMRMHHAFFVPHPERQPPTERDATQRTLFADEVANICAEIIKPNGPVARRGKAHIKFSGYSAGGQKATDDRYWAFGFCVQCLPLYDAAPQHFVKWPERRLGGGAH